MKNTTETATDRSARHARALIGGGVAAGALLLVAFVYWCVYGFTYTVAPGFVAVRTRFGKLAPEHYTEGLYLTGFSTFESLSTRTQTYTMAGAGAVGQPDGAVRVLSSDQLAVTLDVTVQFHTNPAQVLPLYRAFGRSYAEDVVHTLVRASVRDAASTFTASRLATQREALQATMETMTRERLHTTLGGRGISPAAIVLDNILLRDVDFPDSLDAAIAAVQVEVQQAAAQTQRSETARRVAATALITAQGEVNAQLERVRGETLALAQRTEAQAAANRALQPTLTAEVLRLRQIDVGASLLASNGTRTVMLPNGQLPQFVLPSGER